MTQPNNMEGMAPTALKTLKPAALPESCIGQYHCPNSRSVVQDVLPRVTNTGQGSHMIEPKPQRLSFLGDREASGFDIQSKSVQEDLRQDFRRECVVGHVDGGRKNLSAESPDPEFGSQCDQVPTPYVPLHLCSFCLC